MSKSKLYSTVDQATQSYTGKLPVKWVRIHNLPDFVYFNHAHVTGKRLNVRLAMDLLKHMRFKTICLTKWVGVSPSYRKLEVKVEGNEYYTKIHEQLSKKYA
jgi:hypothetical protein